MIGASEAVRYPQDEPLRRASWATSSAPQFSKVPEVALGFWIIKILATTLGETGGDAVTMSMNLGYAVGTLIFLAIFLATVTVHIRSKSFNAYLYWLTIVATTTVGTTIADFVDRSLGIGYLGGSTLLFACLMASLAVWRWSEGTVSVNTIVTPKAETFYWVTILFSQTLGTALGDWVADTNDLGYGGGAILFAGALVVILVLYAFTQTSRVTLFWAAFILTRPLGATLGDLLDKPADQRRLRDQPLSRLRDPRRAYRRADCSVAAEGRRPSRRAWRRSADWLRRRLRPRQNKKAPTLDSARLHLRDKIADVLEVNRHERRGEVVAHAGNDDQFGAGDALGGVLGARPRG